MTAAVLAEHALLLAQPAAPPPGWSWTMLPTILLSAGTALGAARLLELLVTRRRGRGEAVKVEVDAASVISGELRQWTAEANARAKSAEDRAARAEERSVAIEARLQTRIDDLVAKLDDAESKVDRLTARIASCQAGPICPVRTGDTNPGMHPVRP